MSFASRTGSARAAIASVLLSRLSIGLFAAAVILPSAGAATGSRSVLEVCTNDPVGSTGAALHLSRLMATATIAARAPPCDPPSAHSYLVRFDARAGEVWVVLTGPGGTRLERRVPWLDGADRPLIRLESAGRLPDLSLLLESLLAEDRIGPLPTLGPAAASAPSSIGQATDGGSQEKTSRPTRSANAAPRAGAPRAGNSQGAGAAVLRSGAGTTASAGAGTSPSIREAGAAATGGEREADGAGSTTDAGGTAIARGSGEGERTSGARTGTGAPGSSETTGSSAAGTGTDGTTIAGARGSSEGQGSSAADGSAAGAAIPGAPSAAPGAAPGAEPGANGRSPARDGEPGGDGTIASAERERIDGTAGAPRGPAGTGAPRGPDGAAIDPALPPRQASTATGAEAGRATGGGVLDWNTWTLRVGGTGGLRWRSPGIYSPEAGLRLSFGPVWVKGSFEGSSEWDLVAPIRVSASAGAAGLQAQLLGKGAWGASGTLGVAVDRLELRRLDFVGARPVTVWDAGPVAGILLAWESGPVASGLLVEGQWSPTARRVRLPEGPSGVPNRWSLRAGVTLGWKR